MEEKKLTDEELLEVMKICIEKEDDCDSCPLQYIGGCMYQICKTAFDYIQRLQDENRLLETKLKNEIEEHKQFVKLAQKVDEGQKEEIERLQEELKVSERNLTVESRNYESSNHIVGLLKGENAELQKQVDELTEELDFYKCANRELTSTNDMLKGIAKCKNVEVE